MRKAAVLLVGSIMFIIMLFISVLVSWLGGMVVVPIATEITSLQGVQAVGYDSAVNTAMTIGLGVVVVLLPLTILAWMFMAGLRNDSYYGRT